MDSEKIIPSKISKFIFYSHGSSSHTQNFLNSFSNYPDLNYKFVFYGKNNCSYQGIVDKKFSSPFVRYSIKNPVKSILPLRFGSKKAINLIGIYRRAASIHQIAQDEEAKFIYSQGLTSTGIISYLSNIPYITTIWGSDFNLVRFQPELKELSRQTLQNAILIHVLSKRQKQILSKEGLTPTKIFVQHFGVRVEDFYPKQEKEVLKRHLGYPGNIVIFAPRGHSSYYRPVMLLEVIKLIQREIKNLKVIITGEYKETPNLIRKAKELQLDGIVHFVGRVSRPDYIAFNQMADLYLQTPGMDGVAVSIMESLASGTPPVSSNVDDASENILHGYNGLLIDGDELERYSSEIAELLNDKPKLNELRKNGLNWAKKHCRRDTAIKNILSHLMRVSESHNE